MIICHCSVIRDKDITKAAASTIRGLCNELDKQLDCGTCAAKIKQYLKEKKTMIRKWETDIF